jgi:hypothetical protein
MTGVVSTYKECLKHLKQMQDASCSPEAAAAAFEEVAAKCNKLRAADRPPKATWKRLVLDMQVSVVHKLTLPLQCDAVRVLHSECSCAGWL